MPTNYVFRPAPIDKGKVGGKTADASTYTSISKAIAMGNVAETKVGLPVKFSGNANGGAIAANNGVVRTLRGGSPRTFGIEDPTTPDVQARLWTELNYTPLPNRVVQAFSGLSFYIVLIDQKTPTSYVENADGVNYSVSYNPDTDNKLYWDQWPGPNAPPTEYRNLMVNTDFEDKTKIIFTSLEKITLKNFSPGTNRNDILTELNARFADAGVASPSGEYGDLAWNGGDYTRLRARISPQGNFILTIDGFWYSSLYLRPGPNAYVGLFFGGGPDNKQSGSALFGVTPVQQGACGVDSVALLIRPGENSVVSRWNFAPADNRISNLPTYGCSESPPVEIDNPIGQLTPEGTFFVVVIEKTTRRSPGVHQLNHVSFIDDRAVVYDATTAKVYTRSVTRTGAIDAITFLYNADPEVLTNDELTSTYRYRDDRYTFTDPVGGRPPFNPPFVTSNKGSLILRSFNSGESRTDIIDSLNELLSTIDVTPSGISGSMDGIGPSRLVASLTSSGYLQLTVTGQWYNSASPLGKPSAYVGLFFGGGPSNSGKLSTLLGITDKNAACGVDSTGLVIPSGSRTVFANHQLVAPTINFTINPCTFANLGGGFPNDSTNINNRPLSGAVLRSLSGASFFIYAGAGDRYLAASPSSPEESVYFYTDYSIQGYNNANEGGFRYSHEFRYIVIHRRDLPNGSYATSTLYKPRMTYEDMRYGAIYIHNRGLVTLPLFPPGTTRNGVVQELNNLLTKQKFIFGPQDFTYALDTTTEPGPYSYLQASLDEFGHLILTIKGPWAPNERLDASTPIGTPRPTAPYAGLVFTNTKPVLGNNGSTALGVVGPLGPHSNNRYGERGVALLIQQGQRSARANYIMGDNTLDWDAT